MAVRLIRPALASVVLFALLGAGAVVVVRGPGGESSPQTARNGHIREWLAGLPLSFIENRGQADPRVDYYVHGGRDSLFFTPHGLRLSLGEGHDQRWTVEQRFVGAPPVEPLAGDPLPGVVSYFTGPPGEWKTGIPTYDSVAYPDLWPGIDLVYSGDGRQLKYDLVVRAGADPSRIGLSYRGATDMALTPDGGLRVSTPVRDFREQAPYAYQESDGDRVQVPASFDRHGRSSYGFRLGSYDTSRPLIIDPVVSLYAGYIGGSERDRGRGIAVDDAGNAYVTGSTDSTEATFPVTVGPDTTFNGGPTGVNTDAFVAKVHAGGTGLAYAGYIGGSSADLGFGIAVDASGNAYVTGSTGSTEATFPVKVGPDTTHNGSGDAFVAKVNPGGTGLLYAGYIGGSGIDEGRGIAVDGSGSAYVTGATLSTEATFPVTLGPDSTFNGQNDAFAAKVNPGGTGLLYAGYIGGSGTDTAWAIAVNEAGSAHVAGLTTSTEATFPVAGGPDLSANGGTDAFVAKVNPGGTGLDYAGYIGGSGPEVAHGIAVDGMGGAHVAGVTSSTEATFPVTVGPDTTYNGGPDDAFVAKVNSGGTGLDYAGYFGGSEHDRSFAIAVDDAGSAYITGDTDSSEATLPVTDGPDTTHNGGTEGFVAKIDPTGNGLVYAGYVGGSLGDLAFGIAVDASGNAYVVGETSSTESTFPVTLGPDTSHNGGFDAFVAKVGAGGQAVADMSLVKSDSPDPVRASQVLTYTLTVTNGSPHAATEVTVEDQLPPGVVVVSATASQGTCVRSGGIVTCDLQAMSGGERVTVVIRVRPQTAGTLINQAEVSSAEPDPDPSNNSDVESTRVRSSGCRPPRCV